MMWFARAIQRGGVDQAPVAQLDRAPDFESGGQGFESLPARHRILRILVLYERGQLYVFRCENVLFRRAGQSRDLRQ